MRVLIVGAGFGGIATIDYRPLTKRYGTVFQMLHSDLHDILRELVQEVRLRFETTVVAFEEQPQGVIVTLSDGTQEKFDLVVGADGIHSHVRNMLFGDEGFTRSGLRMWLSMLPCRQFLLSEPNDLFGEGRYIGMFPTKDGALGVLFLATVDDQERGIPERAPERIVRRFRVAGPRHSAISADGDFLRRYRSGLAGYLVSWARCAVG